VLIIFYIMTICTSRTPYMYYIQYYCRSDSRKSPARPYYIFNGPPFGHKFVKYLQYFSVVGPLYYNVIKKKKTRAHHDRLAQLCRVNYNIIIVNGLNSECSEYRCTRLYMATWEENNWLIY
jgi:hypothetical protein